MIHVQNWKIYTSNYNNDSTDLCLEFKKAQLHFTQYGEQMGVPVKDDIVCRAKRPSVNDTDAAAGIASALDERPFAVGSGY